MQKQINGQLRNQLDVPLRKQAANICERYELKLGLRKPSAAGSPEPFQEGVCRNTFSEPLGSECGRSGEIRRIGVTSEQAQTEKFSH